MPHNEIVLMAEDDEHDVMATRRAWKKCNIEDTLVVVRNGEECLDYLYRRGDYADAKLHPAPKLLLLDLNMPKLGGIDVLEAIHGDEKFSSLPVVILTTSDNEPDLKKCYALGANAYIIKPIGFDKFTDAIKKIDMFWKLVKVPSTT